MLKRLSFNIIMLAFLFCGASVGMEALGLLFADGNTTSPKRRLEALIARIEADGDNPNVPREAGAEHLWPAADPREAAGDGDRERKAAETAPLAVSLSDSDEPAAATSAEWEPRIVVEARLEAEDKPHRTAAPEPDAALDAPIVVADRVAVPPPSATRVRSTEDCSDGCRTGQAKPGHSRQQAATPRRRPPRAVSISDCPLFGWL